MYMKSQKARFDPRSSYYVHLMRCGALSMEYSCATACLACGFVGTSINSGNRLTSRYLGVSLNLITSIAMGVSTKEVQERDEAGNLTATYIQSQSGAGRRVDVVVSHEAL